MQMSNYAYTCAAGETFDSVARQIYGKEKYAAELLSANPEYCGQCVFFGGEKLYLPVIQLPQAGEENLPSKAPWK